MIAIFENDLQSSTLITEAMNKKFMSFMTKCKLIIYNLYKPLL
jgi:hypothetical protein